MASRLSLLALSWQGWAQVARTPEGGGGGGSIPLCSIFRCKGKCPSLPEKMKIAALASAGGVKAMIFLNTLYIYIYIHTHILCWKNSVSWGFESLEITRAHSLVCLRPSGSYGA